MRVDAQAQRIFVGVRELAYGVEPRLRGPVAVLRAELGRRAHARYAEACAAEADVDVELPVALERELDGWRVRVSGRCDALIRDGDGGVVEEVKSVVDDVDARSEDDLAAACRQARLYALGIDEARETTSVPLRARVVLVSLADGARRHVDAGYRPDEAAAELAALVAALLEVVSAEVARAERRRDLAERIAFPQPALRAHQGELMEAIAEGLVAGRPILAQAPTGIGKTVSALVPALRHAFREGAAVYYLTSKTTQRDHVAATFEQIALQTESGERGRPDVPLSAVTLRRKDQMCPPGDLRCHPEVCPLLARFDERAGDVIAELLEEGAVSPDRLFARGAEMSLCPYELSRELAARADLVIGDFNHVFDGAVSQAASVSARRRVVIVDEAHNLFDRARGYESPFIGVRTLSAVEASLGNEPLDDALSSTTERVRALIEQALKGSDEGVRAVMDGCAPHEIDTSALSPLADEVALLAMRWSHRRWQRREVSRCDPVLELAGSLMQLSVLSRRAEDAYVGYVAGDDGPDGRGLGILCVDPSTSLERTHGDAVGTIAMSATLSPLDYFSDVLGLARLNPLVLSAPSPFPRENREVIVVPTVSTTRRERDEHAPEIARLIEKIVSVKPGRYIAYFSSYAYLSRVQSMLTLPRGQVLVQLPTSIPAARALLLRRLTEGDEPRLLLAVLGGVYGEGIDLPGDLLIGAIIVGPGLPALSFERLAMRHHYDATREAGFAYAMVYPGLQRVIQAAGRVIRSEDDRGIIALIDRRFAEPDYAACLPEDWYRYDPGELQVDDPTPRLSEFWGQPPAGDLPVGEVGSGLLTSAS